MRWIAVLALMASLLHPGGEGVSSAAAVFRAHFCPECWVYLWDPGSRDLQGNCEGCGKYPVEFEAQRMSWVWCEGGGAWRSGPCSEDRANRCCTWAVACAAVVPFGHAVLDKWYCPAHRTFTVSRLPILMQIVCGICARPAVRVGAMERAWYWCEIEGVWDLEPCPMNLRKKCCADRRGLLLVRCEPGPIAK